MQPVNLPKSPIIETVRFTGRLITSVDASLIGAENFSLLQNMRYKDVGIEGVLGMSKINTAATAYTQIDTGFHFKKDQPTENHILVQTTSGSNSRLVKADNSASIPSADTLTAWLTLANNNVVRFAKGPNDMMIACNGATNYAWGGTEHIPGQFIDYAFDGTYWYDYTKEVSNTVNDANNRATLHNHLIGGAWANTLLLLHLDNNVTDSSGTTPHTVTNNNVTFSTSTRRIGTHAAVFNGTTANLTIPDNADFDLSGGTWTLDCWIYITSLAAINNIYHQNTTTNADCMVVRVAANGSVQLLVNAASSAVIDQSTAAGVISTNTWYHLEVVENGDDFYIFINGTLAVYWADTSRAANYTSIVTIGSDSSTNWFTGNIDEIRLSNVARHTANFTPSLIPYSSANTSVQLIGSPFPLTSVKYYVGTANASASVPTVAYWTSTGWSPATDVTDGTVTGGAALAQTGTISFTASSAVPKVIRQNMLYFYFIAFPGLDSGVTVYQISTGGDPSALTDIWDGVPRSISSAFIFTTVFYDYTTQLLTTNYGLADTSTYVDLTGLTSSQYLYIGSFERLTALIIKMVGLGINVTAKTVMTVDYWNGTAWVSQASLEDGTSLSTISLSQSGTVSWNPPAEVSEKERVINEGVKQFYYRIHFSTTLAQSGSNGVVVDSIFGIPAQNTINPYRFPVTWRERLCLCNNQVLNKNELLITADGSPFTANGTDSTKLLIGGPEELIAGATLFTRYGSSIFDNLILCKRNATYLIDGTNPDDFKINTVSSRIGCVAASTMKRCDISTDASAGNRHVIIWQSTRGIEMFDGNALTLISDDIKNFFDPTTDEYIKTSLIDKFYGEYDEARSEYHWFFASGSSATGLNEEWVYDLKRRKWFEIVRTGVLNCAFPVEDAQGVKYLYGGTITTGFVMRLENGQNWASTSNAIAYVIQPGDILPGNSLFLETALRRYKLFGKAKNTSSQAVAITHYVDGISAGTSLSTVSQVSAGATARYYNLLKSVNGGTGTYHAIKLNVSTSDETKGFEPLFLALNFEVKRSDTT